MCGIFGVVAGDINVERARIARDTLTHRGPDQAGEWTHGPVYLGHRRLSIMDLSEAGRQPMVSEDDQVAITVNGELYNFQPLRDALEALGYRFQSHSDSEVVLHGYRAWGLEALLEKIDGMYAIVIFDKAKNQIIGVRDRTGIKPLFYGQVKGHFAWASELKALVSYYDKANLPLDNTALYDFLTYRYIPAPKTAYQDLAKLPPAHTFVYDIASQSLEVKPYWQLPTAVHKISLKEAVAETRRLMQKTVAEQMVADVPVGFFLSGGIDSSLVVAEASALSKDLHTFTIGFGVKGFDETDYAKQVATHFNTRHTEKIITSKLDKPFSEWLHDVYDEPFADTSALPTWYVSQLAREHVTVVLTGDGGDELFGGYKWYKRLKPAAFIFRALAMLPRFVWRFKIPMRGLILEGIDAVKTDSTPLTLHNRLFFSRSTMHERESARKQLNIPADYDDMWFFRKHWKPELGWRRALQYLDFHTFMVEDVLTKVDRATMQHALEARVPFLSREVVEFAFSLPAPILYTGGALKGLLKKAYKGALPDDILTRGKKGFSLPWHHWKKDLSKNQNLQQAVLMAFHKGT